MKQGIRKRYEKQKIEEFQEILKEGAVYTVFQPIIDLVNGNVLAYEALSRIDRENSVLNIAEMFEIADDTGHVWALEKLCRKKALKAGAKKPKHAKLFLNVDGNVLQDPTFIEGFTSKKATKQGLQPSDIVFEITERSDVENYQILQKIIQHYKKQGYEIALDDVGAGYSGLNRVVNTNPGYLKADMELVRDIDKNQAKQAMIKLLQNYCDTMGYRLIAEGIETKDELETVIQMGVRYGQGYFLGRPERGFK